MIAQAFGEFFRFVANAGWVLFCTLFAVIAEAWLLAMLLRRRSRILAWEEEARGGDWKSAPRPSWWPGWAAALLPLVFIVPVVMSAHASTTSITTAPSVSDAMARVTHYSSGISGLLTLHPYAIGLGLLLGLLATVTCALALTEGLRRARLHAAARMAELDPMGASERLRRPIPVADDLAGVLAAFFLFGIWPILAGGHAQSGALTRGYQVMSQAPAATRPQLMVALLAQAQETLDRQSWWQLPGLALAATIALILLWPRRRRAVQTAAEHEKRAWAITAGVAIPCVALGVGLLHLAGPYQAEAEMPFPLPATVGPVRFDPGGIQTPELRGPDQLDPKPRLELSSQEALLDGEPVTPADLPNRLRSAQMQVIGTQGPSWAPADGVVVLATPDAPMTRLTPLLRSARDAGYVEASFGFLRLESTHRPILGRLERVDSSGATTRLVDSSVVAEGNPALPTLVRPDSYVAYQDFAREVVRVRVSGEQITLDLGPRARH